MKSRKRTFLGAAGAVAIFCLGVLAGATVSEGYAAPGTATGKRAQVDPNVSVSETKERLRDEQLARIEKKLLDIEKASEKHQKNILDRITASQKYVTYAVETELQKQLKLHLGTPQNGGRSAKFKDHPWWMDRIYYIAMSQCNSL